MNESPQSVRIGFHCFDPTPIAISWAPQWNDDDQHWCNTNSHNTTITRRTEMETRGWGKRGDEDTGGRGWHTQGPWPRNNNEWQMGTNGWQHSVNIILEANFTYIHNNCNFTYIYNNRYIRTQLNNKPQFFSSKLTAQNHKIIKIKGKRSSDNQTKVRLKMS